jgi:hypothetical protein
VVKEKRFETRLNTEKFMAWYDRMLGFKAPPGIVNKEN